MLEIRRVTRQDMPAVINLLQSISAFSPQAALFDDIWDSFNQQGNLHAIVALLENKIVRYGAAYLETKIRGGKMAHIEDIVTNSEFRRLGIGTAIVTELLNISRRQGCYKASLQCSDANVPFYEAIGFSKSAVAMQVFFD